MDLQRMCMSCLRDRGGYEVCMHCGYVDGTPQEAPEHLPQRTLLKQGRYLIGRSLSDTQQEITYAGYDCERHAPVTIREYFPREHSVRTEGSPRIAPASEEFESGLRRFLTNSRMQKPENGLKAADSFRENGTAYLVLSYAEPAVSCTTSTQECAQRAVPAEASCAARIQGSHASTSAKRNVSQKNQSAKKAPQPSKKAQSGTHRKAAPGRIVGLIAAILIIVLGAAIMITSLGMYTLDVWLPVESVDEYRRDSDPFRDALQNQINDPMCTLNITVIPADEYETQLTAAFERGSGPDLYALMPGQSIPMQARILSDIVWDEITTELPLLAEYLEGNPDARALPIGLTTCVLYYNARTGAPNLGDNRISWKEVSAALTAQDENGLVWEGPVLLALPEAADALSLGGSAYAAGDNPPGADPLALFREGTLPYLAAGTGRYEELSQKVTGCAVLPLPGEGAYLAECTDFFCIGAKDGKELATAKKLLLAMCSEDVQSALMNAGHLRENGALPMRAQALEGSWAALLTPEFDSLTLGNTSIGEGSSPEAEATPAATPAPEGEQVPEGTPSWPLPEEEEPTPDQM